MLHRAALGAVVLAGATFLIAAESAAGDPSRAPSIGEVDERSQPVDNEPPTAVADPITVVPGSSVRIRPMANDRDPDDGDLLTLTGVEPPVLGGVAVEVRGTTIRVRAPLDASPGVRRFAYSVVDGQGATATGELTVTVSARARTSTTTTSTSSTTARPRPTPTAPAAPTTTAGRTATTAPDAGAPTTSASADPTAAPTATTASGTTAAAPDDGGDVLAGGERPDGGSAGPATPAGTDGIDGTDGDAGTGGDAGGGGDGLVAGLALLAIAFGVAVVAHRRFGHG